MWPHPPARSILVAAAAGTDDPLPALTTMPSPRSSAAARAESAVAARRRFSLRPDLEADLPERSTVFGCPQPARKTPGAIDFRSAVRQGSHANSRGSEAKIRGLQSSLLQDAKFPTGSFGTCRGVRLRLTPSRLCAAAFPLRGCVHSVSRLIMHNCSLAKVKLDRLVLNTRPKNHRRRKC
jgi:hypothetical protein